MENYKLVKCKILTGTFPHERVFEITTQSGEKLTGAVDIEWVRGKDRQKLPEDQPSSPADEIDGFLVCRVIGERENKMTIEIPSTDVAVVTEDALASMEA